MQSNLRIYLLHFFLNFLCGALFWFELNLIGKVVFKGRISELTEFVVIWGMVLNILIAIIIVNIVSFISFKESKCDPVIASVICFVLGCVGFIMPCYLLL